MLAVVFAHDRLLENPAAATVLERMRFAGIPITVGADAAGVFRVGELPPAALWVVTDDPVHVTAAHRAGSHAVFIGDGARIEPAADDAVIARLDELPDALSPHYARAKLRLRAVIAALRIE